MGGDTGVFRQGIQAAGTSGPIQIGAGPAVGQQSQAQQTFIPLPSTPLGGPQQPSLPTFPSQAAPRPGATLDMSQFLAQRMLSK
ncbi:hypothetical protein LCGC14_0714140 [marine sediment metagenome]|uniref:Uncharacterized protein n=1 Tax=marine sediment metagenome TaxID=412755 RepID=A0A0F9SZT4_9ZZZZ